MILLPFLSWLACSAGPPPDEPEPAPTFVPVQPIVRQPPEPAGEPAASLKIARGRFFSYALPARWQVAEEGQFAVTLVAPDRQALTVMAGNAGVPINYPADQFVYQKLMALQPQDLRLGPPRQATPAAGFAQAVEFDVRYSVRGIPCRGVAKCSMAPAYDSAVMAVTAALSADAQWPGYATWLPRVAEQVAAINGAAFGMRGIMAQNLQNSTAYAEAAREYREWSQGTWQQTTDDRAASEDRRNLEFRENLGGVQTYTNPFGTGQALELPARYQHYWIDRQGHVQGTDDPSADPNVGSTAEWRRLERR